MSSILQEDNSVYVVPWDSIVSNNLQTQQRMKKD